MTEVNGQGSAPDRLGDVTDSSRSSLSRTLLVGAPSVIRARMNTGEAISGELDPLCEGTSQHYWVCQEHCKSQSGGIVGFLSGAQLSLSARSTPFGGVGNIRR